MFPVPGHSAEKVQNDINTILGAIAQLLSKVNLDYTPKPVLAPIEINAVLEAEPVFDVIDLEVIPEYPALAGHDPDLLRGSDRTLINGNPSPPSIEVETQAEVRLQIDDTYIIALLPDLRSQLEQLSAEKVTALAEVLAYPTSSQVDAENIIDAEIIDVTINGKSCFHLEQGQVIVNALLPAADLQRSEVSATQSETQRIRETVVTTEIAEKTEDLPIVQLRPAHEAEVLIGQVLGDSSLLHHQVLQDAAPVEIVRDQYGHVKGGAAVRASVEVTEDAVETEAEYQTEHQPLTPQAKAVLQALYDYFEHTGEKELSGNNDYLIEKVGNNRLRFTPYENPGEAIVVGSERIESNVTTTRYSHLMLRFESAYENLRRAEKEGDRNLEMSR
ncbi:hypothetical protein H6F88_32100 [Oculatella sp. FACHB-28]|uniref:hypothetical protein n=1 Tax=Oculatella sp. FACHB-28 TaxID=2692845 RepID=UPI0016823332|nr:hypothetical protein [Oculatella sp. FACHB-28]MBD2060588.1 hypothetical protein [Oculatella sp. FACHB-28]